jgi:hypothetical protein
MVNAATSSTTATSGKRLILRKETPHRDIGCSRRTYPPIGTSVSSRLHGSGRVSIDLGLRSLPSSFSPSVSLEGW